ncbi:LemA family protein [Desulfobulbus alkaliphilus]|uniref:LemA family protein n=1 Tax=Desulfobulbus alkaliphilus TaxID=869814 RepID=UPI0019665944|nr:LemA family protein [Desulfobulbus alkaliphilus]MBM9536474.1 LemA family protein [Desulfobulbus alkaliphilus]
MSVATIVVLVLFGGIVLFMIMMFNRLVALRNRLKNAFAQIEVQLKRRYDLIPNLVETAKAYLQHERETLEAVVNARNTATRGLSQAHDRPGDPQAMAVLGQAEHGLASALSRFNLVVEAYPELKANQNMMQVSEELTSTENKVAFARQAFNDAVMTYNTYKQSFPQVVVAGMFGHGPDAALLEFADSEQIQAAPKVSFQ